MLENCRLILVQEQFLIQRDIGFSKSISEIQ